MSQKKEQKSKRRKSDLDAGRTTNQKIVYITKPECEGKPNFAGV